MMWGKDQNRRKFSSAKIDTLVGRNTTIKGDLDFKGGLHVEGRIEGNVTAGDDASVLILSETGAIKGEVRAPNLVLNGVVEGDVHAFQQLELAPKSRVTGNVYYNLIQMAIGAEVNGNLVHRRGGKPQLEFKRGGQAAAEASTPEEPGEGNS